MKLINLIEYLKDQDKLEQLFEREKLNTESEAIIICMEKSIDLESEIKLFEIEETGGNLTFEKNGIPYVEFFPAYYAMEFVESYCDGPGGKAYTDLNIAKRLLEYRIKDA
jgi:hypothetical protein